MARGKGVDSLGNGRLAGPLRGQSNSITNVYSLHIRFARPPTT